VQAMGAQDLLDAEPAGVQQNLLGALRWVELKQLDRRQEELSRGGLIDEADKAEFRSLLSRRRELG
jgi:hypothetical protein